MQFTTERLELRVLELEDAVALISQVLQSVNQMLGTLNEISGTQTAMITSLMGALERVAGAKGEDLPPWSLRDAEKD